MYANAQASDGVAEKAVASGVGVNSPDRFSVCLATDRPVTPHSGDASKSREVERAHIAMP